MKLKLSRNHVHAICTQAKHTRKVLAPNPSSIPALAFDAFLKDLGEVLASSSSTFNRALFLRECGLPQPQPSVQPQAQESHHAQV